MFNLDTLLPLLQAFGKVVKSSLGLATSIATTNPIGIASNALGLGTSVVGSSQATSSAIEASHAAGNAINNIQEATAGATDVRPMPEDVAPSVPVGSTPKLSN